MDILKTDYVVVGGGIAGLSAAKTLHHKAKVIVLTKGKIKESSTQYAQGGIAVAMKESDTTSMHYEDTIKAGKGLCNEESVRILVENGPKKVHELIEIGAKFDQKDGQYVMGKEAAHSERRILHAGDSTGKEIERTLGQFLAHQTSITFLENAFLFKLYVENGSCCGCYVIVDSKLLFIQAKAVILATGGCGQVFAYNTNPPVSTGDGIILGFQAGCYLQDMEFVQFHPTTLYSGDKQSISIFLITEAVRGEGAILRNMDGKRFMTDYDPAAELAPRDVVARSIFHEMHKNHSSHVYLDLTHMNVSPEKRFPTIFKRCLEANIDINHDFIPVCPGAHYFMGGLSTDSWGQTNVKNLYAVGEVASLGLHGANRLASNSLLDGLVFGDRAAEHALNQSLSFSQIIPKSIDLSNASIPSTFKTKLLTIKQTIRQLMWTHVGIVREHDSLKHCLKTLNDFQWILDYKSFDTTINEVQVMLRLAIIITRFALQRKESRGAHHRSDFPNLHHTAHRLILKDEFSDIIEHVI